MKLSRKKKKNTPSVTPQIKNADYWTKLLGDSYPSSRVLEHAFTEQYECVPPTWTLKFIQRFDSKTTILNCGSIQIKMLLCPSIRVSKYNNGTSPYLTLHEVPNEIAPAVIQELEYIFATLDEVKKEYRRRRRVAQQEELNKIIAAWNPQ